tara:strand:+ start:554 stop:730 length:177 start_codon:yes stop_codon:yes gene_type:complete
MKNTDANRLKLADAIWETLSLDDLYQQFIHQSIARYETDPDQFEEDCAVMGLDNEGGE